MKPRLSVCFTSFTERVRTDLPAMFEQLAKQAGEDERVEVLALVDNRRRSIGSKLGCVSEFASGEFIACVGDDDVVSEDYVSSLLAEIEKDPTVDAVTFGIELYINGVLRGSVREGKWGSWDDSAGVMWRSVSDKAAIRREIKHLIPYPDRWYGEDRVFSEALASHLERIVNIERVLYRAYHVTAQPFGTAYKRQKDGLE